MTQASDLAKFASEANALFNSITANTTAITAISVGGTNINSTSFAGTANNTSFVGSVSAANVVSNAQLSANLANYQTTAGLSANVATLAANSSTYANASVTNTFTVGTAAYFVANGNFGIGTSTPDTKLLVVGSTGAGDSTPEVRVSGNGVIDIHNNLSAGSYNSIIQAGDKGIIYWGSTINTGSFAIAQWSDDARGIRIDASGNVGISVSPSYKLDVYSASGDNVIASRSAASGAGIFRAVGANTAFAAYNALISTEFGGTQQWYLGGDGVANTIIMKNGTTESMRIAANGNVGIGNTAPANKISVGGSAHFGSGANDFITIFGDSGSMELTRFAGNAYIDLKNLASDDFDVRLQSVGNTGIFALLTAGAERMRVDASGNTGIGNTAPTAKLHVQGTILASDNITAYSDIRLKDDVVTISYALDKVTKLRGVEYTSKESGNRGIGLVAQEVQSVVPEVVNQNGEYLSVAYGNMVGLLIEAIKEQQTQIDKLKEEMHLLKNGE